VGVASPSPNPPKYGTIAVAVPVSRELHVLTQTKVIDSRLHIPAQISKLLKN
jgi:hypothetical protein